MKHYSGRIFSAKAGAISIFAIFVGFGLDAKADPVLGIQTDYSNFNYDAFGNFKKKQLATVTNGKSFAETYTGTSIPGYVSTSTAIAMANAAAANVSQQQQNDAIAAAAAMRASGDGCDNEDNDRIIAELALCSTHAYNIGLDQNPENASDKQLIKDAVALKTTIMTQQMNKQYEYLESMMRRFKTQLEKAVLTTKLQKAGASSGNGATSGGASGGGASSGGGSAGANVRDKTPGIYIDNVQNCNLEFETSAVFKCLANNYQEIQSQSIGGQNVTRELRQQLAYDFKLLVTNAPVSIKSGLFPSGNQLQMCQSESRMSNRQQFQTCLSAHITNIRNASNAHNRENKPAGK